MADAPTAYAPAVRGPQWPVNPQTAGVNWPTNPAGMPGAAATAATAAPSAEQTELEKLLNRFGVKYTKAPAPTPALLAFMRGMGMTYDTADDSRTTALARLGESRTAATADLDRTAERTKQNVTTDLIRRGVLRSGEAGDRYSRQAADVADRRGDIQRSYAEGVEGVDMAYSGTTDNLRQQALERVLNTEEQQATQEATAKAQTEALARQEAENEKVYQQQKASQESYLTRMEELYAKYGGV